MFGLGDSAVLAGNDRRGTLRASSSIWEAARGNSTIIFLSKNLRPYQHSPHFEYFEYSRLFSTTLYYSHNHLAEYNLLFADQPCLVASHRQLWSLRIVFSFFVDMFRPLVMLRATNPVVLVFSCSAVWPVTGAGKGLDPIWDCWPG